MQGSEAEVDTDSSDDEFNPKEESDDGASSSSSSSEDEDEDEDSAGPACEDVDMEAGELAALKVTHSSAHCALLTNFWDCPVG